MTVQPASVADVQDLVRQHDTIHLRASGTKSPDVPATGVTIDLRKLTGIIDYSPDECVFTALAGTPLNEIEDLLRTHGQYMPFDPPLVAAGATIGGTVAAGLSGSGRYRYGGVRDFVIGARVIDGEGRAIRSGGKVVKNAAGFLLHHGMVGSMGRFGVLTELTFKVFPLPEARATVKVGCGSVEHAVALAARLEERRFDLAALDFDDTGTMWIRIAGRAEALAARAAQVQREVTSRRTSVPVVNRASVGVDAEIFEGEHDEKIWSDAREWRTGAVPTDNQSVVKVAGQVTEWPGLREAGAKARYMCGGAAALITIHNLPPVSLDLPQASLDGHLVAHGLRGMVVRGPHAGTRVGLVEHNEFEERVRRVLDPRKRFSAASDRRQ